jgi:pentose-5-phosphate-3-epimerase
MLSRWGLGMLSKQKPIRSEKYLKFVREHACINCGIPAHIDGIDAHHVNGQAIGGGMAQKISDIFTIPLCRKCHGMIHQDKNMIDQPRHALMMIERAVHAGVLKV